MRFIRQVDQTDCGPASLATVLSYWGRIEPIYRLRDLAGTAQGGTNLAGLVRAAVALGMQVTPYVADQDGLSSLELPCILHWEHNHYVVLLKLEKRGKRERAVIWDPALGRRSLSFDNLESSWTGKVLWLAPSPAFETGDFAGLRGLKGLLSHLTHFRGAGPVLLEVGLATLFLGALGLGAPLFSQIIFDRVLAFRESQLLPAMLAGMFLLGVFQTLFSSLRTHISSHLTLRLDYRLHLGYFDHLLRLPLRVHDTRLVGDLLQRFGDLSGVREVLSSLIVTLPTTIVTLIFSLMLIFSYNPILGLVGFINVPLQIAYTLIIAPRLRENGRRSAKKEGELQSFLIGTLEGLSTLKALRSEGWAFGKERRQIGELTALSWQNLTLSNWSGVVFALLGSLGSLFLLWYGAIQVLAGTLSIGQLVAAQGLIGQALGALSSLIAAYNGIQGGIVASDRLAEVLELTPEAEKSEQTLPPLERRLKVENLSFGYLPGQPVLKNVSLELQKGSYTALLGGNGAGKSTFARLLSGLLTPTATDSSAGKRYWDGLEMGEYRISAVRERIVYLGTETPLFYTTLRENLTLGHEVPDEVLTALLVRLGLEKVLRKLPEGLSTVVGGESIFRFSSGEKQMLGLIRALTSPAELLILDEPTATLDLEREARVCELLAQMKGFKTLLVITHRMALAEAADQVLELRDGEIVSQAPPLNPVLEELLDSEGEG